MADAPVLGAGSSECGFKSHLPHQKNDKQKLVVFLSKLQAWYIIAARSAVYIVTNGVAVGVSHPVPSVHSPAT